MDILTQGVLGGVMAQSFAGKHEKKMATLAGVAAGILADADILIRSSSDPLLNIEYHRHFSHSLFFIPVGAALAMLLLWPFMRRHLSAKRLYVFCLAGYSMSGVLDACTSYGTHLFWPFTDERVAFNIISIVDPVFTLILLLALILGLRLPQRQVAAAGLLLCTVYLGLGFVQLQRAEQAAESGVRPETPEDQQRAERQVYGLVRLTDGDPDDVPAPEAGHVFWMEYMAQDADKALAFYRDLSGYEAKLQGSESGIDYHVLRRDGRRAGHPDPANDRLRDSGGGAGPREPGLIGRSRVVLRRWNRAGRQEGRSCFYGLPQANNGGVLPRQPRGDAQPPGGEPARAGGGRGLRRLCVGHGRQRFGYARALKPGRSSHH